MHFIKKGRHTIITVFGKSKIILKKSNIIEMTRNVGVTSFSLYVTNIDLYVRSKYKQYFILKILTETLPYDMFLDRKTS